MLCLSEETFETHFPTVVMVRDYSGIEMLNNGLISVIVKLEEQFVDTNQNAAVNGDSTTRGGFQTAATMSFLDLGEISVKELKGKIILPGVERYLDEVLDCDPMFTSFKIASWANVLREGHWQAPHIHPKEYTIISGIYYVDVPNQPAPAGQLEFVNPHPISVSLGAQAMTRTHQPVTGQLLLFPPYYLHYVNPVGKGDPRIVVSFDVRMNPGS